MPRDERRYQKRLARKPFYVSGPHETTARAQAVVEQPHWRLGTGNFDYLLLVE